MNRTASAGVHRCRSAVSGCSSSKPSPGFQVILRCFTAALGAARSVAKMRSCVVGPHSRDWPRESPSIFTSIGATPAARWAVSSALTRPIVVKKSDAAEGVEHGRTLTSYASETYMHTLGISLLRGRDFTHQEASSGAHVSVISESTARKYWPGEDPIGKHFQLDGHFDGKLTEFQVIGIVKDVRFFNLTRPDPAHVYLAADPAKIYPMLMSVKTDPQSALAAVRNAVGTYDKDLLPSLTLWNMDTMLVNPRRSMSRALAIFAAILALLALSLAGTGIYGVMAYAVSQRTQEIGLRMALGATSSHVLKSVALMGLRPVAAGMIIGIACGGGISGILHSTLASPESSDFLYGLSYYDPLTFLGLACFLAIAALLASLIPALHALRVDPMIALRYE